MEAHNKEGVFLWVVEAVLGSMGTLLLRWRSERKLLWFALVVPLHGRCSDLVSRMKGNLFLNEVAHFDDSEINGIIEQACCRKETYWALALGLCANIGKGYIGVKKHLRNDGGLFENHPVASKPAMLEFLPNLAR